MPTLQRRNRNRGKASESRLAEILGWLRYGVMGGEDLIDPSGEWSGESKSVQKCVVFKWFTQAERNAKKSKRKGSKRPVVIIHLKGTQHEASDLVVMSLKDFQRLTGNSPDQAT